MKKITQQNEVNESLDNELDDKMNPYEEWIYSQIVEDIRAELDYIR